ncbi:hypothetical protein BFRIPA_00178 (plasmid) [Peribacillus frigoritolerans]
MKKSIPSLKRIKVHLFQMLSSLHRVSAASQHPSQEHDYGCLIVIITD